MKIITTLCILIALFAFLLLVMNAREGVSPAGEQNTNEPTRFGSPR